MVSCFVCLLCRGCSCGCVLSGGGLVLEKIGTVSRDTTEEEDGEEGGEEKIRRLKAVNDRIKRC